jgi:long-chain acyl-CoA synthetase
MTIYSLLQQQAAKQPNKTAIIDGQKKISYQDLISLIDQLSNGLSSIGIKKGDRVAFFMEDCYEEVLCYFSCFVVGAIAVPLYEGLRGLDLFYLIEQTSPKIIITSTALTPHLKTIKDPLMDNIPLHQVDSTAENNFSSLLTKHVTAQITTRDETAIALISYTSGSSAKPKGVMHAQQQLIANSNAVIKRFNLTADTVTLVSGLDFNASFCSFLVTTLFVGGTVVISQTNNMAERLAEISKHHITFIFSVPSVCQQLIEAKEHQPDTTHQLTYFVIGGDQYSTDLCKRFYQTFGLHLTVGMGMTETLYQCSMTPSSNKKIGSVGTAMPDVKLKIIDEEGNAIGTNEPGQLCIQSPCMMLGYWQNNTATQAALKDNWLHSGDVGYLDQEGYFWFVDRMKNIILVDHYGQNVSPSEVESVLRLHPTVTDAAVVGKQVDNNGVVCAFVILEADSKTDQQELIDFTKEKLAAYKTPKQIVFLDELPKNARGKLDRKALKKLL